MENFVAATTESFSVSTPKMRLIKSTKKTNEDVLWNLVNYTIVYTQVFVDALMRMSHHSHLN